MAAFVGFDPFKSHRPQMLRLASLSLVVVASLVVLGRFGA
jgi:hypothetical protein